MRILILYFVVVVAILVCVLCAIPNRPEPKLVLYDLNKNYIGEYYGNDSIPSGTFYMRKNGVFTKILIK